MSARSALAALALLVPGGTPLTAGGGGKIFSMVAPTAEQFYIPGPVNGDLPAAPGDGGKWVKVPTGAGLYRGTDGGLGLVSIPHAALISFSVGSDGGELFYVPALVGGDLPTVQKDAGTWTPVVIGAGLYRAPDGGLVLVPKGG